MLLHPSPSSGYPHGVVTDAELRDMLSRFPAKARAVLRRAARAQVSERDELAQRLLREPNGQDLADFVDTMSADPAFRRQVVRVLGWIEARADG
jgi:hypothetical protein